MIEIKVKEEDISIWREFLLDTQKKEPIPFLFTIEPPGFKNSIVHLVQISSSNKVEQKLVSYITKLYKEYKSNLILP